VDCTLEQIVSPYQRVVCADVYWKHQLLDNGPKIFAERPNR
jgi:hypothetical protein